MDADLVQEICNKVSRMNIASFDFLISGLLPKLVEQHFKTTICFSKYFVGFQRLHKEKLNKPFL